MLLELILFITILAVAYAGVAFYRGWSIRRGIIDLPNERSSHAVPTPRGGGLVIVAVTLAGYVVVSSYFGGSVSWGYVAAALTVAAVSWVDDLYSISPLWRLACHFFAAGLLVWSAGYVQSIPIPGIPEPLDLGSLGPVVTVIWTVWLLNAYNFMDGIDGIAGSQAVLAGIGWSIVAFVGGAMGIYWYGIVIAAASLGFLIQNLRPSRIFMGDVGSAFLGFTFAALPILARRESPLSVGYFEFAAIILVWFFVFDSVLTFARRLFNRKKVWKAHREHLYQRLVRAGYSHRFVTGIYAALTLLLFITFMVGTGLNGKLTILPVLFTLVSSCSLAIYATRRDMLT